MLYLLSFCGTTPKTVKLNIIILMLLNIQRIELKLSENVPLDALLCIIHLFFKEMFPR